MAVAFRNQIHADLLDALGLVLPPAAMVTDAATLHGYRHDEASTAAYGTPLVVVLPRTTSDVQHILRTATAHRVSVVPRGAGSGLAGGANAVDGCVVLSMERMDRILSVDADDLTAIVEPGVINAHLSEAALPHGLQYFPDPASRTFSTLGGNIATNAGGLCCVKYGVTRDYVLGLEVVLSDGTVLETGRRTLKGVAGYDLTSLFVGSEGTLGVVTQATLRLRPMAPPPATLVAFFPDLEKAGAATAEIRRRSVPSLLELMDACVVRAVEDWKHLGLDTSAAAMIVGQSDAGGDAGVAEVRLMCDLCDRNGASISTYGIDPFEVEALLTARRLAFPALQRRGTTLLDDVAVPCSAIPSLLSEITSIAVQHEVTIGTFGHAGDGNMHPTIVFDGADAQSRDAARGAFAAVVRAALRLGGTVTAEHGTGNLKREYLHDELGETGVHMQQAVRKLFDPQGILNPGKGV